MCFDFNDFYNLNSIECNRREYKQLQIFAYAFGNDGTFYEYEFIDDNSNSACYIGRDMRLTIVFLSSIVLYLDNNFLFNQMGYTSNNLLYSLLAIE